MELLPDDLIRLSDVPRELPGRPHVSSVFRWISTGVRGIKLRVIRIGGKTFVSRRALLDFIAAVSTRGRRELPSSPTPEPATPRSARRDAAKRRLAAAGVR